jgi:hypothetical protein
MRAGGLLIITMMKLTKVMMKLLKEGIQQQRGRDFIGKRRIRQRLLLRCQWWLQTIVGG